MKDGTFHKDLGLPSHLAFHWAGEFNLTYSQHALRAANSDRYGLIPLYRKMEFRADDVVEVTVENGRPVKAVLRVPLPDYNALDLVLVLLFPEYGGKCFVKTVWFNERTDAHKTLRTDKYDRP